MKRLQFFKLANPEWLCWYFRKQGIFALALYKFGMAIDFKSSLKERLRTHHLKQRTTTKCETCGTLLVRSSYDQVLRFCSKVCRRGRVDARRGKEKELRRAEGTVAYGQKN